MRFHIIASILAAGLAVAAPVANPATAESSVQPEKRGYAALFCSGFCVALIENPPAYAACVAACLATGSEGFDPTQVETGAGTESA